MLGTVHPTVLAVKGQAPAMWFWKPTIVVAIIVELVLVLVLFLFTVAIFGIGTGFGVGVKLRRHTAPPAAFTGGLVLFAERPRRLWALPNGCSFGY